ncbi:MAG: hypothetical protein HQL56_06030 [Magnetococcales bacterium]|nr:hypothetical protein [Magnetococcales bacterium]
MIHSYAVEIREGQVHLQEPLVLQGRHRGVLTILEPLDDPEVQPVASGNAAEIVAFLQKHRLSPEARLSAQEIDQQIAAEREAWD